MIRFIITTTFTLVVTTPLAITLGAYNVHDKHALPLIAVYSLMASILINLAL
jgi:hypothetical protein